MATDKELAKLTDFYRDWEAAQQRVQQAEAQRQMIEQTAQGARADALAKEARFKGAMELVAGTTDVAWQYEPEKGVTFEVRSPAPTNGHVPMAVVPLNHNVRRALRKRK